MRFTYDLVFYLHIVDLAVSSVFLYLIPLPCLLLINIRFLLGLRRFQNRRKRFAQTQTEFTSSNQVRIILNVVVILAVFLVCQSTSLVIWITLVASQKYNQSHRYRWWKIVFLFADLNSAANFWVYLAFLKEFRRAVLQMMARICYSCRNKQRN